MNGNRVKRGIGVGLIGLIGGRTRADDLLPADMREQVAKAASKLPGMGIPDVYYPKNLYLGEWIVEENISSYDESTAVKTAVAIDFKLFQGLQSFATDGKPLRYKSYYIPTEGGVVLDRSASTSSFAAALLNSASASRGISTQWSQQNPNLLTISDPSGQIVEYKVTKRSTEVLSDTFDDGAIGYSEFTRVACVNGKSIQYAVPSLYAMRTLVRYKPVPAEGSIEGIMRRYLYSSDTVDLGKPTPLVTVKSKFNMRRIKS